MKSTKQKTLHEIGGRSLLGHALHAAAGINPERIVTVVGHQRDQVSPAVDAISQELDCEVLQAVQEEQLGTGHAVACGLEPIPEFEGTIIVTNGDVPLLTPETIEGLRATHTEQGNAVTVLSMRLEDPTGYGRIIRAE
ncbi:NTP transferase domain-containing protein, partial [Corynebacterium sp.]